MKRNHNTLVSFYPFYFLAFALVVVSTYTSFFVSPKVIENVRNVTESQAAESVEAEVVETPIELTSDLFEVAPVEAETSDYIEIESND